MCGMLPELQKAIKISIEIPSPEAGPADHTPAARRIKLKKKSDKKDSADVVDGIELEDSLMRKMLPDMNSMLSK